MDVKSVISTLDLVVKAITGVGEIIDKVKGDFACYIALFLALEQR